MPSTTYECRLVADYHFYEEVIKKNPLLLKKLMYINANSLGHKRTSNVISKKIFQKILTNNSSMTRPVLRCSFFDIEVEELEAISDEIERTIKYAIHITDEPPHKSIILTSKNKLEDYKTNPHYIGVKEIDLKCDEEAKELIERYWKQCTNRGFSISY